MGIVVPQTSRIQQLRDLKGMTVAVAKGSSAHDLLVASLESVGLVYGDIKPAYLAPADAASAFAIGAVDAWAIWDPFLAITEITRKARRLSIEPSVARQNAFLLANRDFTTKYPQIVSALNDDVATAAVYTRGHHDAAVQLFSSATGVSIEAETLAVSRNDFTVVPVSDAIVRKQQDVADRFARIKLIPAPIKVADIVWTWTPTG